MGTPLCPHAGGMGLPACWDCTEEGHIGVLAPTEEGENTLSNWATLGEIRKGLWSHDAAAASAPELHRLDEGLEVVRPPSRTSQPGLEVVEGPRVVGPEEMESQFQRAWNTKPNTKPDQTEKYVPPEGNFRTTVPKIRRKKLYAVIAVVVILIIVLIVGIAVGVTRHKNHHSNSTPVSSGGPPTTAPTTSVPAPGPTKTTPISPSPSSTSSLSSRECIGKNGSTYTDSDTGKKYKLECAIAHQGTDLVNLKAETMQACVSLCSNIDFCKGVIWFNIGPQGTGLNYCYLKSDVSDVAEDNIDAQSAVLL
ncbi:hypothetical protein GGS21DRAFT_486755 [Xylaria nigripes]|nr:hypothetical protein GGS21DRAFT_486755 [Xylaria nigripes]